MLAHRLVCGITASLIFLGAAPTAFATSPEAPVASASSRAATQRAWLGVHMGPTAEGQSQGVPIRRAIPTSPAEAAGLVRGDIIATIDGTPVRNADALIRAVGERVAGQQVQLEVVGPNPRTVTLQLTGHPGPNTDFGRLLIGRPLPALQAFNLATGSAVALAPRDGKVRIIELWATWCGPCRAAMPHISRLVSSMDKDRFEFVSVASEDRITVQAFMKSRSVPYTVYFDENEDVAAELWATATPTFVLVDGNGVIVDYAQGTNRLDVLFTRARELTR